MDNYRNKVNEIKAPESLIAATLQKIHAEQAAPAPVAEDKPKVIPFRKTKVWLTLTATAAVLALILTFTLPRNGSGGMELHYNTISQMALKTETPGVLPETLSVEEYCTYLDWDITGSADCKLTSADIRIIRDNGTIIDDRCDAYYTTAHGQAMVLFSKTQNLLPNDLSGGQVSTLRGVEILAAVNQQGNGYCAAFRYQDVNICLWCPAQMDQQTFELILQDVLDAVL